MCLFPVFFAVKGPRQLYTHCVILSAFWQIIADKHKQNTDQNRNKPGLLYTSPACRPTMGIPRPAMNCANVQCRLFSICLLYTSWRMALAAVWVLPVAFAITLFSARIQGYFNKKASAANVALETGVQAVSYPHLEASPCGASFCVSMSILKSSISVSVTFGVSDTFKVAVLPASTFKE